MCRISDVRLSPAERKAVRKLSGVMIPIYASVVLVFLSAIFLINAPRTDHVPHSIDVVANAAAR
jgi:hypothetical protein